MIALLGKSNVFTAVLWAKVHSHRSFAHAVFDKYYKILKKNSQKIRPNARGVQKRPRHRKRYKTIQLPIKPYKSLLNTCEKSAVDRANHNPNLLQKQINRQNPQNYCTPPPTVIRKMAQ